MPARQQRQELPGYRNERLGIGVSRRRDPGITSATSASGQRRRRSLYNSPSQPQSRMPLHLFARKFVRHESSILASRQHGNDQSPLFGAPYGRRLVRGGLYI